MTAYRGEIWLANLNPARKPNEVGKIRPVVIYQTDELNCSDYPMTIVFPLSTDLIDDAQPLRLRITKRHKLQHDSDILVAQIRTIDNSRLIEKLGILTDSEILQLKQLFDEITQ